MQVHASQFSAALTLVSSVPLIANPCLAGLNHEMKTIEEIRRERLEMLIVEMSDPETGRGGVAALAGLISKSPAQVSQWRNASEDSSTGRPRTLNSDTARMIEERCNKERGWMDNPPQNPPSEDSPFTSREERHIEDAIKIFRSVGAEGKAILLGVLRSEARHLPEINKANAG